MATKSDLQRSLGALIDSLTSRFDPFQPADILSLWTELMTRSAACGRATSAWDKLPAQDDRFKPIIGSLDSAVKALNAADYGQPASVKAALQGARAALELVENLLALNKGAFSASVMDLNEALLRIASLDWREEPPPESLREEGAFLLGVFEGLPPHVALLDDGRKVRLLTPLTFVHPAWDPWPVPPNAEIDGASIPRPFWSLIGGPFEGRYRNASIVHDYYCDKAIRPWRDVHRMFFEAMLAGGVGKAKAKIMYYAVYRFGPRWPAPAGFTEAAGASETQSAALSNRDAESLARDAEAIYLHDLNLDEIDTLAETRNATPAIALETVESTHATDPGALDRSRQLVIVGGSGDGQDHEAVSAQASFLPSYLTTRFEKKGVRIIACRNSVTDFESALRGVVPRGWEATGKTWDDVPGCFFPDRKRVVIATIGEGGARVVPQKSSRLHGSADLVVHESLHGFDYIGGHAVLNDTRFLTARNADFDKLGAYEQQDGQAGLEETFAESGARFAVQPDVLRGDWPKLFTYWEMGPNEEVMVPRESLESTGPAKSPIGVAELLEDGSIGMDLRAEGPGGAVGHAWIEVSTGDPSYRALKSKLFGGEEGLESARGRQVLVFP